SCHGYVPDKMAIENGRRFGGLLPRSRVRRIRSSRGLLAPRTATRRHNADTAHANAEEILSDARLRSPAATAVLARGGRRLRHTPAATARRCCAARLRRTSRVGRYPGLIRSYLRD